MDRVEYQLLRKIVQSNDVIYIKSLDRLGRNKRQIKQELEYYKAEGIAVLRSKNDGNGIGRPKVEYPSNFKIVYKQWKDAKITGVKAMELLGLKKNTFYKLVKQYEEV